MSAPGNRATIVYVDGFNFYYGAVKGTQYKWLDFETLCRHLLPCDELVKIRYFTARINDRPDNPHQATRQQAYLRALTTLPLLEIHYGNFVTRSVPMQLADPPTTGTRTVKVRKTEEKGSDVNLATYLLLDACQKQCDLAVVISNDSDLAEAIRVVQSDLDIKVGMINPHQRDRRSRKLQQLPCLFFKQIPRQALANAQLPDIVRDSRGEIHKPIGW